MFYGIIIRMYCSPGEHNPPHFHAYYQNYKVVIDINTCELKEGEIASKTNENGISLGGNTQRRFTGGLGVNIERRASI